MKTKTQEQLEKEIEEVEKLERIYKNTKIKQKFWDKYKTDIFRVSSRKVELKTKLSQHKIDIKNFEKLIDKKIKEYEKHWLDAHKKGDKQVEDIFYNTYTNLKEIKEALKEL